MRKRLTALLLTLALLICLFPTTLAYATEENGISQDTLFGTVTIIQENQKLVFSQNDDGLYGMTTFVRAAKTDAWQPLFDGNQPIVSGNSFNLYPSSYRILSNTADESSILFSGTHPQHGYAWDVLVTREAASSFFSFTITCHLTSDLQLEGLEPRFAFWMDQEEVECQLSQGPDSIYWNENQWLGFNEYSIGFPAAYLYDDGREAVVFVDASPMTWMGRENVNGFDDARVCVFSENGQTGIGFDVLTRTGNTIPKGDMVTQLYLYTGCADQAPSSNLDALDKLIRTCAPLHPSTAELPQNRYGHPMTWAYFASQSLQELAQSRNWETRDFNVQDPIVPEEDREGAPFITGLARPNAKGGFDFSTTNNWLSAWLIYEQLNPDASQADFLRQKIDGLASFYDPEADMIRWGVRQQNNVGAYEMSWQNQFYNVETLRAYEAMRDSDFHPAILANLLDGTDSLTEILENSDYLLPQWYDPYTKEGVVQNDVPALGYIKEPWQIGSYAYIFMKCYEITGDETYAQLAKTALDRFFSSSYSMENDVYSKTYDDPSEFPVTELYGNAYGTVAASMLYEYTGDETYAKYSDYFLDVLLRLTFWYDDNGDEASLTLNNLGLFLPHGGAYHACPWETVEAYLPVTSVVKNTADGEMTTLLAKLYNLSRINSFHFYPATWSPVFSGQLGYNEENKYQPTEPLYLSLHGGNADYGALYMASLAPYNYLMYEAFATTDDNDILILNLDNFDNLPSALDAAERNFLLYNPTDEERQVTVSFSHLPIGNHFVYTESDVDRRLLSQTTYSAQELLDGVVRYNLQPGEIRRLSLKNTDPAVQASVKERATAKSSLSLAYQKVRHHLQGVFAQKLAASYPAMSNDTIQTLSRYVGTLTDYDTAVSHLQAAILRGDSAETAALAMKQAFIDRAESDVEPDASLSAPAYLEELVVDLNTAVATFHAGDYSQSIEQAQAISAAADSQNTLTQVIVSSSSSTYQPSQKGTLQVIGQGTDGSAIDLSAAQISYTSNAASIVSIDSTGTFTAHSPGQALLTATVTLNDVTVIGHFAVEVSQAPKLTEAKALDSSTVQLTWEAGSFPLSEVHNYVIYRDGSAIATLPATTLTYQDTLLQENTNYRYQIAAVNPQEIQTALSNALVVTTPINTTPPQVQSVTANQDTTTVRVRFLESVDPVTAQDPAHYEISGGIVVESAQLDTTQSNEVILAVSGMRYNFPYTLTVSRVANASQNPIVMPQPQALTFRCLPNVVGYWDFEEGAGEKTVDQSGINHLTLTGTAWTEGYLGTGLAFDGTAFGSLEQALLPLEDGYTISAWIKTQNTRPAEKTVLTIGQAGTPSYIRIFESFDGQMVIDTPSTGYRGGAIQVDTDTWRHIAVTNDGSNIHWYTDGALTYSWDVHSTPQSGVLPLILGSQADGQNGFQGSMDEVRIYDRVLEESEIANLYTTVPVTGITLTESLELKPGEDALLEPSIYPTYATDKAVNWTSSNDSVVQVDVKGRITALAPGNATITVTTVDGEFTASTNVVVKSTSIPVESVHLSKTEATLDVDATLVLTATVSPSNATDKNLTWTSSQPAVAEVNASGKVTAYAPGTTTITAHAVNGKSASCVVTVKAPIVEVESIQLSQNTAELEVGERLTLTATLSPKNATDRTVTWTSDQKTIVGVDSSGVVTALAPGEAVVTARSANGKTATCLIRVESQDIPVKVLKIAPYSVRLATGMSIDLSIEVTPKNATNQNVSWRSTNPSVATVDQNGHAITKTPGTTRIYATAKDGSGVTCYRTITVYPPVTKLKIAPYSVRTTVNQELDLAVEVTPKDAYGAVTWRSENPEVATVDQNGRVKTLQVGTSRIYATAKDGSDIFCYRTVTVYPPVTKLKIAPYSVRTTVNQELDLAVEVTPKDAYGAVTWRSENPEVATVDQKGHVVTKATGTARIYATAKDGSGVYCYRTVGVYGPLLSQVAVSPAAVERNSWERVRVSYNLAYAARVDIEILDSRGKVVRTLRDQLSAKAANGRYATWNLKDNAGQYVPSGRYQARVRATLPTGELSTTRTVPLAVNTPDKAKISNYSVQLGTNSATIHYTLNTKAAANFYVYNQKGKLVFTKKNVVSPVGSSRYVWDLKDANGKKLPPGIYQVNMYAWNSLGKSSNAYGKITIR